MRTSSQALIAALLLATPPASAQTTWSEASELPPRESSRVWGSRITVENDPCCELLERKGDEKEAQLIEDLRGRASRNGPVLSLRLEAGSLRIVDSARHCDPDHCRFHTLVAYWEKPGYYVVAVGEYEGRSGYLISEFEGRTTWVVAPPVLSPSGRYAIAWDDSPAYGRGVQLIDMSYYPPKTIKVQRPPVCPGTKPQESIRPGPVWRDDTHVSFDGKPIFTPDEPPMKQLLRIVDGKPEWEC